MSIPRFDIRLRLACMWPILIALRTLHMVTTCDNLLDPTSTLKISRFEVWADCAQYDHHAWWRLYEYSVLGALSEGRGLSSLIEER